MLTKANAVGYAVLALVYHELSDSEVRELNIEHYLNGREAGFAVHFWLHDNARVRRYDRKLVFSQDRSSDAIVVYMGATHEFSMQGNGLTEEIYSKAKYFDSDKIMDAVQYILDQLREEKLSN